MLHIIIRVLSREISENYKQFVVYFLKYPGLKQKEALIKKIFWVLDFVKFA